MTLSFEIDETGNDGKGKVVATYKVGATGATKQSHLRYDDLFTFAAMLNLMHKCMWAGDENTARHHIDGLAEIYGMKREKK